MTKDPNTLNIDYQRQEVPPRVREIIETHLAIETEDAKRAGTLGFMARALAIATMPHRDPKTDVFQRRNGKFTLRMVAGSGAGLPYGSLPRMLTSWVITECVRTRSPQLFLGESFSAYLKELGYAARSGGERGNITRLRNQMRRLFGAVIVADYNDNREGFELNHIRLVDHAKAWWQPKTPDGQGRWCGTLDITPNFFAEAIKAPIPIDTRVYQVFRSSPLAIDIYTWLTYRFSYLHRPSGLIRWEALAGQFGSSYAANDQGMRDFKKAFLRELKRVVQIYQDARLNVVDDGIFLFPSPPHIKKLSDGNSLQQLLSLD